MSYEREFEEAREGRRLADLRLTPSERVREAEALAVLEEQSPRRSQLAVLCEALNGAGARYLVVGVRAAILWGYVRATRDTDILIEPTVENARRVLEALEELGFTLVRDLDPADVAQRPVTMIGDLFQVDLLTIAWTVRYAEAALTARVFEVDGVQVPTLSLDLLIKSKLTDRIQDKADVEELELLRKRLHPDR